MESDFDGPVNIGSEEMISLDRFAQMVIRISGKRLGIRHEDGPTGVRGRNSNNDLLRRKLGWAPSLDLESGVRKTYRWIAAQVDAKRQSVPATFAEKAMV
jgi:nucleoside-diphosphate-sugar epimerase